MVSSEHLHQQLKKYFGYSSFRSFQEKVIQKVLEQEDVLTIMPTGGGKSLIFQLAAICTEGIAVVISPLIALMTDQVNALTQNGISSAFLNSSLTESQRKDLYSKINKNEIKLLYISPEKLLSNGFLDYLTALPISFFAIDEAHCISTWGHDFRPEYIKLSILKERFPAKAIIALTATADKQTRSDICAQLQIADNNVFIDSFDRPNLSLNVLPATNRYKKILEILKTKPFESGIIYCLSRKSTESLAEKLQNDGFKAAFYHAGLTAENRNTIQNDFSTDKIQLICATIAFGMGIDKSNIRWVIHYNLPKNIEGYYQEIGRAGRDGAESDTYLFYSYGDLVTLKQFALSSGQAEIQEAKLESMQQYAEANTCRRKILLSYFNEIIEENCNNCDVCQNPPNTFDATLIAQKALSASYRLEQKVAAGLLIDVLRGSNKQEIIQNQMHTIKTYGAGKDISYFDWQNYILQMVHQGVFEIDFAHKQQLKITPLGNKVLFDKKALYLVKPVAFQTKAVPKIKEENTGQTENAALLEKLKIKRKELAQDNNIPAYLIFNDKTLKDMVMKMPISPFEMLQVSGVGENKLQLYGDMFISIILEHKASNNAFKKSKIATHLQTYQLINEGKTIAEIGQIRQVNESTIIAHLLKCHQEKLTIDWYKYITRVEVAKIIMVAKTCKEKEGLKEIFEKMNGEFSYDKIKIALALANE